MTVLRISSDGVRARRENREDLPLVRPIWVDVGVSVASSLSVKPLRHEYEVLIAGDTGTGKEVIAAPITSAALAGTETGEGERHGNPRRAFLKASCSGTNAEPLRVPVNSHVGGSRWPIAASVLD